jgi:hypothetical protein
MSEDSVDTNRSGVSTHGRATQWAAALGAEEAALPERVIGQARYFAYNRQDSNVTNELLLRHAVESALDRLAETAAIEGTTLVGPPLVMIHVEQGVKR